jgi:D-alanyl-D-alanine carboxypeptidase/D-alanyl-D-alanine-endopeptidase (penicillin-binding protein 4)
MIRVAIANTSILLFLCTPVLAQTTLEKLEKRPGNQITPAPLAAPRAVCQNQFAGEVSRIVNQYPAVKWSILIQTQKPPESRLSLYAKDSTRLLIPGSNNKLFTTAAALLKLGSAYTIQTSITGKGTGSDLFNLSTLRIIGRGDPTLTTNDLNAIAQALSAKGIRSTQLMIGDDTYFRGNATNPNWAQADTLRGYGAPVNSLMVNQNSIGVILTPRAVKEPLRVDLEDPTDAESWQIMNRSVTVPVTQSEFIDVYRDARKLVVYIDGQLRVGAPPARDAASVSNPGNYLVPKFRTALTSAGIFVGNTTLVTSTPAPADEIMLYTRESPPLSELLKEANQESNNLYAETLLKTLGRVQTPDNLDATAAGIAVVRSTLEPLWVSLDKYSMVDGSGLARANQSSAEALARTLQAMALSPADKVFSASLAVGCQSGTLQSRFCGTSAAGKVFAKTGTLTGVVALSGYALAPNYSTSPRMVFSILANFTKESSSTIRRAVDDIVILITQLQDPC